MREGEPRGVQELPPQVQVVGDPVRRVAGHRQVDGREEDADLMRPPGLQLDVE